MLADRVSEGYHWCGFADAKAQARLDRDSSQIIVTVDEGARYTAGEVRVTGAVDVDVARVVEWLTSRQPPAGSRLAGYSEIDGRQVPQWVSPSGGRAESNWPTWEPGEFETLAAVHLKFRSERIRRGVARGSGPRNSTSRSTRTNSDTC